MKVSKLALLVMACSGAACGPPPQQMTPFRARSDGSPLCDGLTAHFVGLPAAEQPARNGVTPSAGSWWIERCSTERHGSELTLHLEGPGWYWVDASESGISVRQQVPFDLRTVVQGTFRAGYKAGLASLWFEPTQEARVAFRASPALELHGENLWGSALRRVPLVPVRSLVAESVSRQASAAIRERLRGGATVTFEVSTGQPDVALGRLEPGEKPPRPFDDGAPWLANDRVLLAPAAAQALGPIEPGDDLFLDVRVERGPGIVYRALCARDMARSLPAVMSGKPNDIPEALLVARGDITGSGAHSRRLRVQEGCPFYLVLSTTSAQATLAAVRLRS